ncbi:hypothetical protein ACFFRR_002839 [Megaselia abdita]
MHGLRCIFLTAWITLCVLCYGVKSEIDNENVNTYDLQEIIEQLFNPSPEYELHSLALRNQLKRILENEREFGKNQYFLGYPNVDEGIRRTQTGQNVINKSVKRSLATLAKNGQLPTQKPEDSVDEQNDWTEKRNVAALARGGGMGKRNIGTLARDYQLPTGKRDMESFLPYLPYYQKRMWAPTKVFLPPMIASGKRNLGALKGSTVHGNTPKRFVAYDDYQDGGDDAPFGAYDPIVAYIDDDSAYNNLDTSENKEKRFLGRVMPPTRATSTTHRSRL